MEVDKLYRVRPQDYRGNTDMSAIILLKGAAVSIGFIGRQALPATKADMINLLNADSIEGEGAYAFDLLPRYICFTGTADSIEIANYIIEEIGGIS